VESNKDIELHDSIASEYDQMAKEYNNHIHEVLFGMCFEYIKPGDTLLDLGIGTGLSSILFAKAGLKITGLDGSNEMLKACGKKGIVHELKHYNIQELPLPFQNDTFSHTVCCGVLHTIGDLKPLSEDIFRILKPNGIFAFTILPLSTSDIESQDKQLPPYSSFSSAWDTTIFKHSDTYIKDIIRELKYSFQKEILVHSGADDEYVFKIVVLSKKGG
jgi:ubiquinone/menaquinone biosynthesis C-methylase UbiE